MYSLEIPGWMHEADLKIIENLAAAIPESGTIVEVGSWMGQSTFAWASNTSATVYAIDLWQWMPAEYVGPAADKVDLKGDPFAQFKGFVSNLPNIKPLRRNSSGGEWSNGPIDLVFIDAMHQDPWVSDDVAYWQDKVKPGGIICGDDYNSMFPAVMNAAQRCADHYGVKLELPGQKFWLVRKPTTFQTLLKRLKFW